jgi:hypothetical protein
VGPHHNRPSGSAAQSRYGTNSCGVRSSTRSIATLMLYVDEHDRPRTQTTLADLVANTIIS